jgi:hypothetical protein
MVYSLFTALRKTTRAFAAKAREFAWLGVGD